jgi:hypothetical protein
MVHAVEHLAREKGAHGLDDGAGLLEQPGCGRHGGAHLAIQAQAAAGVQQQAQAQAAQAFQAGLAGATLTSRTLPCAARAAAKTASSLASGRP